MMQFAKDPLEGDATNTQAAWIAQNKRKIFSGWFASRNLQKDYEDVVQPESHSTMTFTQMVTELKNCYRPTQNYTLANYEFHKLHQKPDESFDSFVNKVKHEAKNCQFSCEHQNYTVPNILICNQIIVGTSTDKIWKNALKNQRSLTDLAYHGHQLEAAAFGAEKITADKHDNSNS